jgi:DNA-binding CsgD family transcriptional regulator
VSSGPWLGLTELSPREREVLALAGAGLTNAQIAGRLGIGTRTVGNYVAVAADKLGVSSRHAAVLAAIRRGDLRLEEIHIERGQ